MKFDAPIPGQSLTGAPKNFPWERPPEMTDPEEVLIHYLERLNGEEQLEGIMNLLELDISVVQLTEGLMRTGVSEGLHSIDVGLLISPVIHEFIKTAADELGMEYEEGVEDKKGKKERHEFMAKERKHKMLKKLKEERKNGTNQDTGEALDMTDFGDLIESDVGEGELPAEVIDEKPKGLMTRRV